jgi:hypothetical protein
MPGTTIQVTNLSSNSPTSYSFYIDGVLTSTLANPVLSFTADGTHQVDLNATNSSGTGSYWQQVLVYPAPVVATGSVGSLNVTIPNGNTSGWSPMVYTFSDPLPAGVIVSGVTLTFSGVDQGWGGTGAQAFFYLSGKFLGSGVFLHFVQNYTITIMAPFPNYNYGGTNIFEMYFSGYPGWVGYFQNGTMTIHYHTNAPPATVCAGNSITQSGIGANTYTWMPAAPNGSSFIPPVSAVYSVTGTNAYGCVGSATRQVTVLSPPVISVPSGTICNGQSFVINPTGAISYTVTGGAYTVSPSSSTSYSVTGTGSLGCVSTTPAIVTVSVVPMPTVSVNSGTVCAGSSFTLQPSGAITYTFEGGTAVKTITANASFTVTGSNALGCQATAPALANVTAVPLPLVAAPNVTICSGSSVTLTASGAVTYSYSSGSPVVTPASTISYVVTGSNAEGCASSSSVTVTVDACADIGENVQTDNLHVFPNPSSGVLYLRSQAILQFSVYDSYGRHLISRKPVSGPSIDLSGLPGGVYRLVLSGDKTNSVQTIVLVN